MSVLRMVIAISAVAGGMAAGVSPAAAQPAPSPQDERFLVQAHEGNLAEIAAGSTAARKGQSAAVRSLGTVLVVDHTALDNRLKEAAVRVGVSLPQQPTPAQRLELAALTALPGRAFDAAWLDAMITGHRTALAAGEQEVRSGSSAEAEQVALSSAPVIQRHLELLLRARSQQGTQAIGDGNRCPEEALEPRGRADELQGQRAPTG